MLLAMTLSAVVNAKTIPADSDRIRVEGCKYTQLVEGNIRFRRHAPETLAVPRKELGINPEKAKNASGSVLAFKTDSQKITAHFNILSANYMGAGFGIYENGTLVEEVHFNPKETEATLKLESTSAGPSSYEIALPSFADIEFTGLTIDDNAQLESIPPAAGKPVYIALGDSISHGVGQNGTTHQTWPFLLSRKMNTELFNLAVGGGKVSVPIGRMLGDWEQIDLITILVGYNDLHFDAKTPELYADTYEELIRAIRTNHPNTPIYCISMLYTDKPVNEKTGYTADQFRTALKELIEELSATDKNLHFIAGDAITTKKNLRTDNPKDPVHLGVDGARLFAEEIYQCIK